MNCTSGKYSAGLVSAMSAMFVSGKFSISVQLAERKTFAVSSSEEKMLKFANFILRSHGVTPIGIA